ncbi:MAG TPA: hypothetical protein PK047_08755, partial [Saprospiraceae bacterium]|nr:hypothetical protein [Saprospiraceae bacterium]
LSNGIERSIEIRASLQIAHCLPIAIGTHSQLSPDSYRAHCSLLIVHFKIQRLKKDILEADLSFY